MYMSLFEFRYKCVSKCKSIKVELLVRRQPDSASDQIDSYLQPDGRSGIMFPSPPHPRGLDRALKPQLLLFPCARFDITHTCFLVVALHASLPTSAPLCSVMAYWSPSRPRPFLSHPSCSSPFKAPPDSTNRILSRCCGLPERSPSRSCPSSWLPRLLPSEPLSGELASPRRAPAGADLRSRWDWGWKTENDELAIVSVSIKKDVMALIWGLLLEQIQKNQALKKWGGALQSKLAALIWGLLLELI
jgi:hypothetical protein